MPTDVPKEVNGFYRDYDPRSGTDKDRDKVYEVFSQLLNFKVEVQNDLTLGDIRATMNEVATGTRERRAYWWEGTGAGGSEEATHAAAAHED